MFQLSSSGKNTPKIRTMTTENEYGKKLVDTFCIKRRYSEAEKMAPCTGELLCKHEDSSLSSQYPHRNAGRGSLDTASLANGELPG